MLFAADLAALSAAAPAYPAAAPADPALMKLPILRTKTWRLGIVVSQ